MIAIGIDPGSRNLGWGVVAREGRVLRHIAHGVIRLGSTDSLEARLLTLFNELGAIVETHRPEIGSVEGIFYDKNAQSAAKLGHARGVVLLCLKQRGLVIREHAPARVKQTLTGHGQAEKGQVGKMVCAILGLGKLPPVDASDALALAITELRLDPKAHELEDRRRQAARKAMPPHLAAAISRAKEKQRQGR